MARDWRERHYGMGDKAGPLDHTGRRFKIDAVDPCGFDAELSDPLYKMIPFLIVDGPAGAHGVFYDNLAIGEMDLGCTIDNYHGLFRSYSAQDGDLDFYVLAGPRFRMWYGAFPGSPAARPSRRNGRSDSPRPR